MYIVIFNNVILHNVIFNKTVTKLVTILTKCLFPYLNPTSYLNRILLVATPEVHIKKPAILLNIYYFTSVFQVISLNSLLLFIKTEAFSARCSVKKVILKNFAKFTGKHLYQNADVCNFIKKEALTQVFCCEFCEIQLHVL